MISIIIPVYNAAPYLPRLFSSLQQQTLSDFEVLLINDGSHDASGQLCNDIMTKDARFLCLHQTNKGVSAARNAGLKIARGNYIAFLDADDTIDSNYLFQLHQRALETDADISICDVSVLQNNKETARFSAEKRILTQTEALNFLLSRKKINSGPCAKLFKRNVLQNLHFPPLKVYEDMLFVQQAFCQAHTIASTDLATYKYIQNNTGAMSTNALHPSLDIITAAEETLLLINQRTDLSPETLYITLSHVMQYAIELLLRPDHAQDMPFLHAFRTLCARHRKKIIACKAFPWKEKIVFIAYSIGYLYHQKQCIKWS